MYNRENKELSIKEQNKRGWQRGENQHYILYGFLVSLISPTIVALAEKGTLNLSAAIAMLVVTLITFLICAKLTSAHYEKKYKQEN